MKIILFIVSRIALVAAMLIGLFMAVDHVFPLHKMLNKQDDFARLIIAEDGTPLRAFPDQQGVWRYPVSIDDVSPVYIKTLLAYEDRWFWYHPGVNPLSMLRASVQNLIHGRVISGGSTITMQVARLIDPHERTLTGKLKQMFRALQLEWYFSKEKILTLYLNRAPFGGPLEGVQAASFAYLGKSASQLSQAEAALLSVLPQSPSRFRPDRNPERATRARDKVLERLFHFGHLSMAEVNDARMEVVIAQMQAMPMMAPILARRLKHEVASGEVLKTTIDSQLQANLETLVKDYTHQLPGRSSAAVLVVNHHNMAVKAYVASADFFDAERYGQVDMIQAIRSPGSTLKPFLYAMALDQGLLTSHSMLMDEAVNIEGYQPENFSKGFAGAVSMNDALQRSLNVPAIQVLQFIGPGYFHAHLQNAGLNLHLPLSGKPNLSLILGGGGTRLEQLVSAYSAFSRGGKAAQLRYIATQENEPAIHEKHLMSSGAAWIIRTILSSVADRESLSGIINRSESLAWKTGTSYGFRDAWAIGMTDHYTIGIWTGRPDGTPVPGYYGAQTAVPLLKMVTANLSYQSNQSEFIPNHLKQPESVSRQIICWPGGRLKSETAVDDCHKSLSTWVLDDTVPPALESDPDIETALKSIKIVSITDGAKIRSPYGSDNAISVNLEAKGGSGATYWFIDGKPVNQQATRAVLSHTFKQPGEYNISAIDDMGQSHRVTIFVKQ